jgi:hypothetical protein
LLMKKPHPCGGARLLVLRAGMDFRLQCTGCGRQFLAPRVKIEKHVKAVERPPGTARP